MRLYHFVFSTNARRAVMTAVHLEAKVDLVAVDLARREHLKPGYLALNPNGKVPVLEDDGFVLWESHAIMQYLADKTPGQTVYPQEARARADVNRWLFWSAHHFQPAASVLNWEHNVKPMIGLGAPDPAAVKRGEELIAPLAAVLDAHLGGRTWVAQDKVTLADEVGYAILVVMETLSPAERTAFVLHDLFGVTFDEVAAIVGRTPAAVRQLASRARRHVRGQSPWPSTDAAEHRRVVEAFASAATSGDLAALIRVLDPDVVLVSDGGGLVTSARKPVLGADRVARFLLGVLAKEQPGDVIASVVVNGAPGFAIYQQGELVTIVSVTVAAGRVTRLDLVRAPGKLPRLVR